MVVVQVPQHGVSPFPVVFTLLGRITGQCILYTPNFAQVEAGFHIRDFQSFVRFNLNYQCQGLLSIDHTSWTLNNVLTLRDTFMGGYDNDLLMSA